MAPTLGWFTTVCVRKCAVADKFDKTCSPMTGHRATGDGDTISQGEAREGFGARVALACSWRTPHGLQPHGKLNQREEVGDTQTLNLVHVEPQTEHPKVEVSRTYVGLAPEALCSEPDPGGRGGGSCYIGKPRAGAAGTWGWSWLCLHLAVGRRSVVEPPWVASLTQPCTRSPASPSQCIHGPTLRGLLSVVGRMETTQSTPKCFLPPRLGPRDRKMPVVMLPCEASHPRGGSRLYKF